jgi:hypothetical protein
MSNFQKRFRKKYRQTLETASKKAISILKTNPCATPFSSSTPKGRKRKTLPSG